jgi:aspartate aminotransferase
MLKPSATIAMDVRTKALISRGVDIVNLTAGEPDFDTPIIARAGGIAAIEGGFTRYTATAGIPELRAAIATKLANENGLTYEPSQIVVSNGAKQSIYNALMVLLDPGDEVILPTPGWVSYPEMVRLAGGIPVFVDTRKDDNRLTPSAVRGAITPKTKLIVINSPNNPTGAVYTDGELRSLAALAVERGIYVISDEIYEKLVYGAEFVSIASIGTEILSRTVTVNGFSKAYAMTGWRMGYAAGPHAIAEAMANLQSQCTSGASSISQRAALAAINGDQAPLEHMRLELDRRRRYVVERLSGMAGVEIEWMPEGAFYVFPRVDQLYGAVGVNGSVQFAERLLEGGRVAVVPGLPFGSDEHIRISYATSPEQLAEGMDRLDAFLRAPA